MQFFSLCNWNDESGPSRLVMTCFYTDHGDNALIVPQQRYNVPPEDWHSDEEYINWTLANSNPPSITFRADGKFGLSIKSALLGTANVTANTVDTRAKITPYFSLHILVNFHTFVNKCLGLTSITVSGMFLMHSTRFGSLCLSGRRDGQCC